MSEESMSVSDVQRSVLDALPPDTNVHALMPGVTAYRGNAAGAIRMPNSGRPYAVFVLAGALSLHQLGAPVCQIKVGRYAVSNVYTPPVADASGDGPWLTLAVDFSVAEVTSILLELDKAQWPSAADNDLAAPIDHHLLDSLARLVAFSKGPDSAFLVRHARRELIYRLLTGAHGIAVANTVARLEGAADIYHVNSWIKQNYRQTFSVEELASASGLSSSAFHRKFKSAVQMGPLQCQKALRLSEARKLLLEGETNVADAAVSVGYESVSQFTREYKREFGSPPGQDLRRVRSLLREITRPDRDPDPGC